MKTATKLLFATVSIALITACGGKSDGGGGNESANSNIVNYNYAQHNGSYRCREDGSVTAILFDIVFIEKSASIVGTGALAGIGFTYDDKVGFVEGKPFYSEQIKLTTRSETAFFFNGNLTLVTGPTANVPNLLAEGMTSRSSCTKL